MLHGILLQLYMPYVPCQNPDLTLGRSKSAIIKCLDIHATKVRCSSARDISHRQR
jgi:hypothetical protein